MLRINVPVELTANGRQLDRQEQDALNDQVTAFLLEQAAVMVPALGARVRFEVAYPREVAGEPTEAGTPASWDVSGDALEVDFSVDPPAIATLPPYSEVAP
jgi:hypothetical protein